LPTDYGKERIEQRIIERNELNNGLWEGTDWFANGFMEENGLGCTQN
jgi:hypothetical protein